MSGGLRERTDRPPKSRRNGWKHTPKGDARPVLGRKFCATCGRWRLLVDFGVVKRSTTGTPVYWKSDCRTCANLKQREKLGQRPRKYGRTPLEETYRRGWESIKNDPERLERKREYARIFLEIKRREKGIPKREWRRGSARDKGYKGYAEAVDAGPFIEWLDGWIAHQDQMRYGCGAGAFGFDGIDRPIASLEDLAELAGCSVKAFWRARHEGRVTITLVDRVLIAAGADVYLIDLYPDLYEDAAA